MWRMVSFDKRAWDNPLPVEWDKLWERMVMHSERPYTPHVSRNLLNILKMKMRNFDDKWFARWLTLVPKPR